MGWIQTLVLFLLHKAPSHGYELIESLRTITQGRYKPETGAIYTLLRRLERNTLAKSTWEQNPSGPDRRLYRLTVAGEEVLKCRLSMLKERIPIMQTLVEYYEVHLGKGR